MRCSHLPARTVMAECASGTVSRAPSGGGGVVDTTGSCVRVAVAVVYVYVYVCVRVF